jgi:hypothetical protein
VALAPIAAAVPIPGGDITTVCAGTVNGTTFTLTANCGEVTTSLTVPPTITTVNGAGFTISGTDIGSAQFNGGILTNASAGQTMNIQNLTVTGPAAGFQLCTNSTNVLYGIYFNDASGTVSAVTVTNIFQAQNGAFGSCQTGRAIRAEGVSAPRTVTITSTVVRDYQKTGFEARGSMTMSVSDSTAGPPRPLAGLIAQNGVTFVGASGSVANSTIFGSGDQTPGPGGGADGTAMVLFGANDVTVTGNTLTGLGTNIGIAVVAGSTGIVISFNSVGRTGPDSPDPTGFGIAVDPPNARISATGALDPLQGDSGATLICNTFSGWNTNIVGAVQISCTPFPAGTECEPYSASVLSVEGGTAPFTWSVASGTLPPGLSFAPADGAITGTPTSPGTFDFTVQVTDSSPTALTATQPQTITIAPNCAGPTTTTGSSAAPTVLTLPPTGGDGAPPLYFGLAVLAVGALVVTVTTRRRASHPGPGLRQ